MKRVKAGRFNLKIIYFFLEPEEKINEAKYCERKTLSGEQDRKPSFSDMQVGKYLLLDQGLIKYYRRTIPSGDRASTCIRVWMMTILTFKAFRALWQT